MIVKTKGGFKIRYEKDNKVGPKVYTKQGAEKRIRQLEWFKAHSKT